MKSTRSHLAAMTALTLFSFSFGSTTARAEDSLSFVRNPGGGEIVYGTIGGKASLENAMVSILKDIHNHFGDKPQIGRFFQTKGSGSVATFFSVNAKNQDGKPIAGLAIVSAPADSPAIAGVIYDSADHFASSANTMLKTLGDLLPMSAGPTRMHSDSRSEAVLVPSRPQPLQQAVLPDNSGSIGLPAGWQVLPSSGGGAVHARGPNGEIVNLGVIVQNIYDTRNPKARGMMQYLAMGHNQFTACQYGGDLVSAYKTVTAQVRQHQHLPTSEIEVLNERQMTPSKYESASTLLLARMDLHDGSGPLIVSVKIGAMPVGSQGQWAMTLGGVGVPEKLAEQEWPTMQAIVKSYGQNAREIQHQTDIVIADINLRAEAARGRANVVAKSNDARNQSIDQTNDDHARANKSFQNYQFDQTVVQDNDTGAHGTIGYSFADALVKSDPNRYEYVPQANFRLGTDYW